MKRTNKNKESLQTPQEFAEKNWGALVAAAGLSGAGILLLIRYYRHRQRAKGQNIEESVSKHLEALENETKCDSSDSVKMLETALPAKQTLIELDGDSGAQLNAIIAALAKGLPDDTARQILEILRQIRR